MGQKINPVSLRLHYTNRNFDNCWYSHYFYKTLINKDILLQSYLNNFLKLQKLPTGRYSIQHLQKKTQVYNFFCYSKSTRQWRSKVFGLAAKTSFLKKNRFFFKNKTEFKKKRKKYTTFFSFYNTISQNAVHRIQKRITSFQNYHLWSVLQKTTSINRSTNNLVNLSGYFLKNSFQNLLINKFTLNYTNLCQQPLLIEIEKINQLDLKNNKKNTNLKAFSSNYKSYDFSKLLILTKQQESVLKIKDNSSLFFLKNLFTYKTLKPIFLQFVKNKNALGFTRDKKALIVQKNLNSSQKKRVFLEDLLLREEKKSSFIVSNNKKKGFTLLQNLEKQDLGFNTLDSKYKRYLESSLSFLYKVDVDLIPFRVKNDWQHANYLAEEIVYFLEKRIPFRRLKNKILKQLSKIPAIRGIRITCSGRVGGKSKKAQRAKTECIKYGQTSLHVFSSKIDFSMKTAFTSFGSVGVKVWICYY